MLLTVERVPIRSYPVSRYRALPCMVHPDLGHPPDFQEYLGLLSEQFNTTQTFKSVFDNVLLEHGGLPHVLPLAVHLIFLPG